VDFGLAKAANQIEATEPGVVKGKFSYLSPEAASGLEVDHRADIFSCGIILFEMLTGRRLFYGESDFQTVELVRKARVPPMAPFNPEISRELEGITRRCLARDPDDRFQHAYELQEQIAHYIFSRGLKVTNRDIARLVRQSQAEYRATIPPRSRPPDDLDHLIQEELVKFTSLESSAASEPAGARPISPDEIDPGTGPLDPRDFIDTRSWTGELEETDGGGAVMTFAPPEGAPVVAASASLEDVLEGEGPRDRETQLVRPAPRRGATPLHGLLIVMIILVVLGAATLLVLNTLGVFDRRPPAEVQEIPRPEP